MGISFEQNGNTFKIQQQSFFKGLNASLENCPDLFPVLAVLCAFAESDSHLYGAPQLKFKESDRIAKTAELLSKCGCRVTALDDGLKISAAAAAPVGFLFDPEHDHRMAMAAALLKIKELPVEILNPSVINKSYPQFYQHIGLNL
jgi:3-phosphoshikimate 1-carboxyvinyltransferase